MNDVKPRREMAGRPPCLLISGGGHEKKGIEPENFFSRIDDSINSTQRIDPLFQRKSVKDTNISIDYIFQVQRIVGFNCAFARRQSRVQIGNDLNYYRGKRNLNPHLFVALSDSRAT